MKRGWLFFFFIFTAFQSFAFELKNFEKEGIEYVWDRKDLMDQGLQVYLEAFSTLYSALNVENRESHFVETMKHEKELAEKNPENIRWLIALKEGKAVGISIVEFFKYPDVYVRELAVLPDYQKKGIGKTMTFALLKDLPDLKKISIVTRRINLPAIDFYKALGFAVTDFSHSEYDPNRYIGMEWPAR